MKKNSQSHSSQQAKMFKLALVVLLSAQALARPSLEEIDPHIVGGTPAQEGQFPFIVSLRQMSGFCFCGGALLSEKIVVTAAHCVADKKPLRIGAGSVNLSAQKIYDVEKIIVHPKYETRRNTNDIAILRLRTPVAIGGNVQTINFPVTENLDGKQVTGLGWGRTSAQGPASSKLLFLNRPIINNEECAKRLQTEIIDSQICLGSEKNYGMCFGDSGSPLLYKGANGKNYIAGVVSWGIPCAKGYPDVFTRVSAYVSWIKENMK